jgi:hypothetical protein
VGTASSSPLSPGGERPDDGKSATWLTRGEAGVSQRTVSECGDDKGCSRSARARRALLAACAAFMVVVGLGFPGSGCLNPRPEELPSADLTQPNSPDPGSAPIRETCDDNPLLAGCDLPDQDINDSPVSEPPADTAGNLGEGSPEPTAPGDAPSGGDNGAGGDGAGGDGAGSDAGADMPADAGAP